MLEVQHSASSQIESCDVPNQGALNTEAMNTIKRAVAAATATSFENNASTYSTAVNAALAHHQAYHSPVFHPGLAIRNQGLPLASYSFPTLGAPGAAKFGLSHLGHRNTAATAVAPSARQMAIHSAVHPDYKRIYMPLRRPPRLPTAHEAMVVAAISTAAPATSVCR